MADSKNRVINREEQGMTDSAQENQQDQWVKQPDEDRADTNHSHDSDHYPIRIHDPDIESVVGLGYD